MSGLHSSAGAATTVKKSGRKWSDSWKQAVKGVLTKHRRERIRYLLQVKLEYFILYLYLICMPEVQLIL